MLDNKRKNTFLFVINLIACFTGAGLIAAFALGLERNGSFANAVLQFFVTRPLWSVAGLLVSGLLLCLPYFVMRQR